MPEVTAARSAASALGRGLLLQACQQSISHLHGASQARTRRSARGQHASAARGVLIFSPRLGRRILDTRSDRLSLRRGFLGGFVCGALAHLMPPAKREGAVHLAISGAGWPGPSAP